MGSLPSAQLLEPPRRFSTALVAWFIAVALLGVLFGGSMQELARVWNERPEFSLGAFIPFIVLFLVWRQRKLLQATNTTGSWLGVALVALGMTMRLAGDLAVSWLFVHYGLVITIIGLAFAQVGAAGMRSIGVPLAFLFLMVPLPEFIMQDLSQRLQLVSSWLGVTFIRWCDISVFREGNMIDLGEVKLQVAEACSGLRYLFSLASLGIIAAYLFNGPWWAKLLLVVSTVPITVFTNSLRIAVVALTVERYGPAAATGPLHDFEGLAIFVVAIGLLAGELWLLGRMRWQPRPDARDRATQRRSGPAATRWTPTTPFYTALALLAAAMAATLLLPERSTIHPERSAFRDFPLIIDGWTGRSEQLEQIYLDVLKLDDYLVADFTNDRRETVNTYIQYYAAQDRTAATHSPRLCIPAGGWEIATLERHSLADVLHQGAPLAVNRAVITRGEASMLVYYWFQQRGRNTTHEYGTKILILWDALVRSRTDGAMVRLVTRRRSGESLEAADDRLSRFAQVLLPRLTPFIPE